MAQVNETRGQSGRDSRDQTSRLSLEEKKRILAGKMQDGGIKNLPDFPPRVDMEQRWIDSRDPVNLQRAIDTLFWEPRPADSISNYKLLAKEEMNGISVIKIAGQILMERPIELGDIERDAYHKQTQLQYSAVGADFSPDKKISGVNEKHGHISGESAVTMRFEKGREPILDN